MSTLRATNIADTSGGNSSTTAQIASGRAKAWAAFNQTTIRSSFNVSSIVNSGSYYTVNFTNAMPDANYSIVTSQSYRIDSGYVQGMQCPWGVYSTTQFGMQPYSGNSAYMDTQFMQFAVFR